MHAAQSLLQLSLLQLGSWCVKQRGGNALQSSCRNAQQANGIPFKCADESKSTDSDLEAAPSTDCGAVRARSSVARPRSPILTTPWAPLMKMLSHFRSRWMMGGLWPWR